MGLQYPQRSVRLICWACHGTGFHLQNVQPITFKPCWMCYGSRGIYQ